MGKTKKEKDPNKIGMGNMILWSASGGSVAIQVLVLGYIQIYCTNALGLNAALVGTLLFASKIVDAFTDLGAGFIIDRTHTRWGKGRPYEFAIFGLWLCTWLLFSVPARFSTPVKMVWVLICYMLAQSVFYTLKNAAGNVYMVRAFNSEEKYVKLNSWGGLVSVAIVVVFNVAFPMFYAKIINDAAGWSRLIGTLAIPLAIIGFLRFFFIKEEYDVDAHTEKVKFSDIKTVLTTNKNIYPIMFLLLATGIAGNLGNASYYYLYIVGNVEISGVISMFTIIAMLTMIFYPALLKKYSVSKFVAVAEMATIISGVLGFFAKGNLVMLAIASVVLGIVSLPASYMSSILIVQCADYNEWQGRPRMEGTMTSVTSFCNKVGSAFGSFIMGILLTASGFDAALSAQPGSALLMIRLTYSLIPAAFYILAGVAMFFGFGLDKLKPQIDKDLQERRAKEENKPESV